MRGRISQGLRIVYYYLTFACNLDCKHCYVGDHLSFTKHADYDLVISNLKDSFSHGARKLVFLGGEPSLHPRFFDFLDKSAELGYENITVDTNGASQYPVPLRSWAQEKLTIRIGFEGIDATTHDYIRGKNTFNQALDTLHRVMDQGIKTEVTVTINALNFSALKKIVQFFDRESVDEINFHFVSMMGNCKKYPELRLSAEQILSAQVQLTALNATHDLPIRFPRLLQKREISSLNGWNFSDQCRLFNQDVLLLFPEGQMCRCPLQIDSNFSCPPMDNMPSSHGQCPFAQYLITGDIPEGYEMTCISWKEI